MTTLLFILLIIYTFAIGLLIFGFYKMTKQKHSVFSPKTNFSIVVPFRNEAENLPKLLHSISLLNYPKTLFEVILVDDDSEEELLIMNYEFEIQIVKNKRKSNSPKKDAIETAIKTAKHDWIITTDADCLVQKNWLSSFDNFIQEKELKMIAAGVCYLPKKGFLHDFQTLDFLSLQGATIGSFGINKPFMCNGANFAYNKDFFIDLHGFDGNATIASGDDVFLLQKGIQHDAKSIGFLYNRDSIVATQSVNSWKELFMQRVRWAAKSTGYSSLFGKGIALLVFFTNLSWVIIFLLWLLQCFNQNFFMLFIGIKFLIDLILIMQTSKYFQSKTNWILLGSLFYPFFSTSVALYSLFGSYNWKGRRFKK